MVSSYVCAVCGEVNEISIDESAGDEQSYIEDCQVCCRPNVLRIRIDEESGEVEVTADFEE